MTVCIGVLLPGMVPCKSNCLGRMKSTGSVSRRYNSGDMEDGGLTLYPDMAGEGGSCFGRMVFLLRVVGGR